MVEKGTKISRMIQQENCDDIIAKEKELILIRINDIENDKSLTDDEKKTFIGKLRIELGKANRLIK
jgi:hypothetical protein